MKYATPTGVAIAGTWDKICATAGIATDKGGCIELPHPISHYSGSTAPGNIEDDLVYSGSTEVHWDSQRSQREDGEVLFVDDDGELWRLSQLVPVSPKPIQIVDIDKSPPLNPCSS